MPYYTKYFKYLAAGSDKQRPAAGMKLHIKAVLQRIIIESRFYKRDNKSGQPENYCANLDNDLMSSQYSNIL